MLDPHLEHSEEFQKDGTHSEVFDKLGNGLVLDGKFSDLKKNG